jgi:hypothetical protein
MSTTFFIIHVVTSINWQIEKKWEDKVMVWLLHSKTANRVRIQTFQWQKSGQHTLAAKKLFFKKCLYFMQIEKVNFLTLLTNWIEEKIIFILYKAEKFNFFS